MLCGCSNLRYLALIAHPGNLVVLTLVISGENLTLGMLGSPTEAFLSSLVNRQHTAAQYALPSSLVNLLGKMPGFFAAGIALTTGQVGYFIITVLSIIPAMALFVHLRTQVRDAERLVDNELEGNRPGRDVARPEQEPAVPKLLPPARDEFANHAVVMNSG